MIGQKLRTTLALTCGLLVAAAGCTSSRIYTGCSDPDCSDPFCTSKQAAVAGIDAHSKTDCDDPNCTDCKAKSVTVTAGDEDAVTAPEPQFAVQQVSARKLSAEAPSDSSEQLMLQANVRDAKRAVLQQVTAKRVRADDCAEAGCGESRGGRRRGRCTDPHCRDCSDAGCIDGPANVPRELDKTTLPRHVIEPPDILLIEAIDNLRVESSPLHAGDMLVLQVGQTVPVDPTEGRVDQLFKVINGMYTIGVDGYVDLGPEYGKVLLEGLNLADARARMDKHLRRTLKNPKMYLAYGDTRTRQLISGQHLVRPDGTVSLGIYGPVYVTGMTIEEAQHEIQTHLAKHIHRPQVAVDVLAYNSKFYYVVADNGGAGEQVIKLPCTGNETVLDAIANIRGLPTVASKSEIWIARPAPAGSKQDQILDIKWDDIVQGGSTDTNYQLLPGDRLYVKADKLIIFDTFVAKLTAPWERLFGFTLLGNGTVRALQRGRNGSGGFGFGF